MQTLDYIMRPQDYTYRFVDNLKNGIGRIDFYEKIHPSSPFFSEGYILLKQSRGGVLPSIGRHQHIGEREIYTCVYGTVNVNGQSLKPGETAVCKNGDWHDAKSETVIAILHFAKEKVN